MTCERQYLWLDRTALLQPPLHRRDLRSGQMISEQIERDCAVGFGKDSAQICFDLPHASVTDLPSDQRPIFAVEN